VPTKSAFKMCFKICLHCSENVVLNLGVPKLNGDELSRPTAVNYLAYGWSETVARG
jgi:hypothetical protein